MSNSIGQEEQVWGDFWNGLTPESEIQMWDYYGGRPWILKYVPRFGKVIEAGCGLGRYNFYLSRLGIDIDGLDFFGPTIEKLNEWAKMNKFNNKFIEGDVTKLPYKDNSISGYISLGVIEHFIEGPHLPLMEAFRVLRPGGVAVITTPSVSFSVLIKRFKKFFRIKYKVKKTIKKILRYPIQKDVFFQYEYRPKKLKRLIEKEGFVVTQYSGTDLMYPFCELYKYKFEKCKEASFAHKFANRFENTFLKNMGAQSISIAVKINEDMHCFLCGEFEAKKESLNHFTVPVCKTCEKDTNSHNYNKNKPTCFATKYIIEPPKLDVTYKSCDYCGKEYYTDILFEDFGFTKNVCSDCMKKPKTNIDLSNNFLKHIWRKRVS